MNRVRQTNLFQDYPDTVQQFRDIARETEFLVIPGAMNGMIPVTLVKLIFVLSTTISDIDGFMIADLLTEPDKVQ